MASFPPSVFLLFMAAAAFTFQRSRFTWLLGCCGGGWHRALSPTPQQTRPDNQDARSCPARPVGGKGCPQPLAFVLCLFFRWDVHAPIGTHLRLPGFLPWRSVGSPAGPLAWALHGWFPGTGPLYACSLTSQQVGENFPPMASPATLCPPAGQHFAQDLSFPALGRGTPSGRVSRWAWGATNAGGPWSGHGQPARWGTHRESQHHLVEVLIARDPLLYCSKGIFGTGQRKRRDGLRQGPDWQGGCRPEIRGSGHGTAPMNRLPLPVPVSHHPTRPTRVLG